MLCALVVVEGYAQDEAARGRMIEEIVVTAERREEHLHDVPVTMSALDDAFMRQEGVTDLEDIARYIPNVRFDEAGTIIQPRIRGFSTNTIVNRGLELPVGIVIDEVPYSRADYFASGLFDLERVEVLRGPQGQLFGANTTVGLVNVTTKNPTDEYTGFVDGHLGELDARRFEAGVGGPLIREFLNFRIAGLWDEREGYVDNTTVAVVPRADDVFGGRERGSGRVKLDFPNLFGASLLISYQRDHLDYTATPREITSTKEKFRSLFLAYDPNTDFTPDNLIGSIDSPSFRTADFNTVTARGHYDLGDWGLNVVFGWADLSSHASDDADGTAVEAQVTTEKESANQTTFELRVTSPDLPGLLGIGELFGLSLGSSDFTSGFFFQRRVLDPTETRVDVNGSVTLLSQVLNMIPGDFPFPVPAQLPREPEFFANHFEQTGTELAGYGQMNWRFWERWTLLYGMRFDHTTKDASTVQVVEGIVLSQAVEPFEDDDQHKSEFHFSPKVGLKFDWNDDVNFYGTWSTNFQAGGFNNFSTIAAREARSIDPAHVEAWEAGTKARLLDGTAEVNLGLFWMTMTDFQLFTLDSRTGLPISHVVNVGELRSRGVEADSTWFPTEWLTLRGSIGFNDTEYLEFPIGTCFIDNANTDGDGDPRCDLAGRPFEHAPHWVIAGTPSVRIPLSSIFGASLPSFLSAVAFTQALTVQYVDNHYLNDSNDPRTRQPSFFRLNGSLGFENSDQGWSLHVRAENLTDERTANTAFEGTAFGGVAIKTPDPPRVIYGGFRWAF